MANLFNWNGSSPDYVGPAGSTIPRKTEGTFFGMFPGTPEYVLSPQAASREPSSGPCPQPSPPPPGSAPPPPPPTATPGTTTEIVVRIDVPGLVHLHGSLALPQAPELTMLALPWLVRYLEQRLVPRCSPREPSGNEVAPEAIASERGVRPDTEERVYERE